MGKLFQKPQTFFTWDGKFNQPQQRDSMRSWNIKVGGRNGDERLSSVILQNRGLVLY